MSWKVYRDGASEGTGVRRLRLLIVDDEARILESLAEVLGEAFEVITATSGDEALAAFDAQSPELVLSDQRMPHRTGIDLLKEIQAREPSCVRMLITGYSDIDAVIDAVNHQVLYRYVSKPWENDELRAIVFGGARKWLDDAGVTDEALRRRYAP